MWGDEECREHLTGYAPHLAYKNHAWVVLTPIVVFLALTAAVALLALSPADELLALLTEMATRRVCGAPVALEIQPCPQFHADGDGPNQGAVGQDPLPPEEIQKQITHPYT